MPTIKELEYEERRFNTMDRPQLLTRLRRIRKKSKLEGFIITAHNRGMWDLVRAGCRRLYRLHDTISEFCPIDLEDYQIPADDRIERSRRNTEEQLRTGSPFVSESSPFVRAIMGEVDRASIAGDSRVAQIRRPDSVPALPPLSSARRLRVDTEETKKAADAEKEEKRIQKGIVKLRI